MSRGYFYEQEQHEKRAMAARRPRPGSMPDAESLIVYRTCSACGHEWATPKRLTAAASASFSCPPSLRDGSSLCGLYGEAA